MALATIYTGSDIDLNLTIKDSDGNAIDLDGAEEITVNIFQQRKSILAVYDLTNGVEILNAANGLAVVHVNRSVLSALPEAKLYAQVIVDIEDANFEDGYKRNITSDILLGQIKQTVE